MKNYEYLIAVSISGTNGMGRCFRTTQEPISSTYDIESLEKLIQQQGGYGNVAILSYQLVREFEVEE